MPTADRKPANCGDWFVSFEVALFEIPTRLMNCVVDASFLILTLPLSQFGLLDSLLRTSPHGFPGLRHAAER